MSGLTPAQHRVVSTLLDDLVPGEDLPDGRHPGAGEAGGADYVQGLLSAFDHDPPRIWAGGPFSGRHGGDPGFEHFLELSGWETMAWRRRIEDWSLRWTSACAALGEDYPDLDPDARERRRGSLDPDLLELAFTHAVESLYGDPVYGGNRHGAAWRAIDHRGDTQPAGWTDAEVSAP